MELVFEQLKYLYFLLFIPVIVITHFLVLRFTKKQSIPFGNFDTLSRISKKYVFTQNNVQLIIRILCITVVVFSLAAPVAYIDVPGASENTIFLVDASDSMLIQVNGSTSWDLSKKILNDYAYYRNYFSSLSVVTYSTVSKIIVPPTKDSVQVYEGLADVLPHGIGGTDMGTALINSLFLASTQTGATRVVVMTDGLGVFGNSLADALQLASDEHIRIEVITTNLKRETLEVEESLIKITELTGGDYIDLSTTNPVTVVDHLVHPPNSVIYVDLRELLLVIALILLTIEWALSKSIFKTVPHE